MNDTKYPGMFSGMNLPHELGFRTFHSTDCGWSSCFRNSTHFHCRTCGYGTSQVSRFSNALLKVAQTVPKFFK